MLILIEKDSATKVARDVADLAEAQSFAAQGFAVSVVNADASVTPLAEYAEAPAEVAEEFSPEREIQADD